MWFKRHTPFDPRRDYKEGGRARRVSEFKASLVTEQVLGKPYLAKTKQNKSNTKQNNKSETKTLPSPQEKEERMGRRLKRELAC